MSRQHNEEEFLNELEENNFYEELRPHAFRSSSQQESTLSSRTWSLEKLLRRLRASDNQQDDKLAAILDVLGEFGTFQRRLVALTFIPNMVSAFFLYADYFVFTNQTAHCNTSWILEVAPNLSEAEQMNLTLPRALNGTFQRCLMYLPVQRDLDSIISFGLNKTKACQNGWIYPDSKSRSLVNEFDLVCGKEQSKETVHTVTLSGILSGALIFGSISDKFGRYPTILMSLLGMAIFGFGTAFVSSFHQYLFFRFAVSQAVVAYSISSVSLVMEWLVGVHRAHAIILEHCFFAVGVLAVSGSAYKFPHWRLLFLVGGVPMIPFISYIWVVKESPRWLMMKGKVEEAKKVLVYAADINKTIIPANLLNEWDLSPEVVLSPLLEENDEKKLRPCWMKPETTEHWAGLRPLGKKMTKASILDFYNNGHLFKVVIAMGCICFTVSYTYFTMSLKMKHYGRSIYFQQAIPGIMEMPARLCSIIFLEQIGRKWSLTYMLTQATIICFLLLFLPQELKSTVILILVLGQFTLASIATVFFVYTSELLPTVLRSTGLGMVSVSSAIGAIVSLTVFDQVPFQMPIFICCVCSIFALCFTSLVPETQDQPIYDSLQHLSKSCNLMDFLDDTHHTYHLRNREPTEMKMAEESLSDDDLSEEVLKNTLLNAQHPTFDTYSLNTDLEQPGNMEEPSMDS